MKHIFILLVIAHFFFYHVQVSYSQERGMKPVQVTIEGIPNTLYQQSHALLIGISSYTNGWTSLPGVTKDVPRVKEALEKNGFQVEVVMSPLNKAALDKAFSGFISKYGNKSDNRLLVYYAGHGHTVITDWGGELGYLVPADAPIPLKNDPTIFQSKAMEMAQIEIYAKRIQSKHAIFIFDACFAGSIFTEDRSGIPEYISYSTVKPVRQFITSGSADETVADASYFCDQFIEALDGKADYDGDGYLTGSELGHFLKKEIIRFSNNRQHPQSGKINDPRLDDGDFVFVMEYAGTSSPQRTVYPTIEEESMLLQYGTLKLTTEVVGSLYLDGTYMQQVNANTVYTLNNLIPGTHSVKITGDERVEEVVTISPNQTTYLTIDKHQNDGNENFTQVSNNNVSEQIYQPSFYELTKMGNKVYLDCDYPNAKKHASKYIQNWGYWNIIEKREDADFILKLVLKRKWPDYGGYAQFIDPKSNIVIKETNKVNTVMSMSFNIEKAGVKKIIRKRIKPLCK